MPEFQHRLPPPPMMPAVRGAASELDRAWFRANPTRYYRMRRPLDGEVLDYPGMTPRVLVWRFAPNARMRLGIYFATTPPDHECPERMARVFFHDAVEADPVAWQAYQFCQSQIECTHPASPAYRASTEPVLCSYGRSYERR